MVGRDTISDHCKNARVKPDTNDRRTKQNEIERKCAVHHESEPLVRLGSNVAKKAKVTKHAGSTINVNRSDKTHYRPLWQKHPLHLRLW